MRALNAPPCSFHSSHLLSYTSISLSKLEQGCSLAGRSRCTNYTEKSSCYFLPLRYFFFLGFNLFYFPFLFWPSAAWSRNRVYSVLVYRLGRMQKATCMMERYRLFPPCHSPLFLSPLIGIGVRIDRGIIWPHGGVLHEEGGPFGEAKKVRRTGGKWPGGLGEICVISFSSHWLV